MKTIQEMLQELSQCIVTVSGEFRFRTNWNGGKVPQPEKPDLDVFDPNVPFCIENVGDVQANVQYNTRNNNIKISKDYKTWNDYASGTEIELNPKDRVYIKSDYVLDESTAPKFNFTNANGTRLRARGNIASLLYGTGDEYITKYTIATQYCYNSMFDNCASLTQAPDLPATTLADHCYYAMFSGCTSLTQAPDLPATTLADYCYRFMFNGCASLTQAPELPATTLADYCYDSMFQHCTSLTQAPNLPATTLTQSCYIMMFRGCTGLTQTPELPATTLAKNCYDSMFANCTSLTQAPELPTVILADYCYGSMFYGCASLVQATALPATTLATGCYSYMFKGCTSLTQAPELPATTLAGGCYYEMFSGCVKINYIKCLATNTSATNCTKDWLNNVSSTGTFECDNKKYFTVDSPNGIPVGWSITEINPDVEKPDLDAFDSNVPFCIENVGNHPVEFGLYNSGKVQSGPPIIPPARTNCKISYDLKSWQDYEIVLSPIGYTTDVNKITLQNKGDRVYIKADYKAVANKTVYTTFVVTGTSLARYRARGNIVSLNIGTGDKYKTDYLEMKNDRDSYRFYKLFDSCTGLTQAPELPATTLADSCYSNMFRACLSLTQAPELPATILASNCYNHMFESCRGLTQAPELPAMTLAYSCYSSMFEGCTNLIQAPELPATKLANSCYSGMFSGCTSLIQAPELLAMTLAQYCYYSMFNSCNKLNYVKCLATDTSATNCTTNWLNNVATTGTFECDNKKYFTVDSPNGIPVGWTITEINPDPPTPPAPEKPDLDTFDPNVPFCIENVGDVPVEIGLCNIGTEAVRAKRSNCKVSTDMATWSNYNIILTQDSADPNISKITLSNKGDRIYIKADANAPSTNSDYTKLTVINQSTDTKIRARGNIASLTYGTDDLYKSKYLIIDNNSCYRSMFGGCTSLVQAPELPATTLASYCYYYMFDGCTSLTQTPDLPATTLATSCYRSMFKGCTSLTKAPELPATALKMECYYWMFRSCKKLNYVKCLATDISAISCTTGFLELVASTGDFYAPASTNWTTGENGIPSGWARHDIT